MHIDIDLEYFRHWPSNWLCWFGPRRPNPVLLTYYGSSRFKEQTRFLFGFNLGPLLCRVWVKTYPK